MQPTAPTAPTQSPECPLCGERPAAPYVAWPLTPARPELAIRICAHCYARSALAALERQGLISGHSKMTMALLRLLAADQAHAQRAKAR